MTEHNIRNFAINFGPQHPAAHGVLRLVHAGRLSREKDPHLAVADLDGADRQEHAGADAHLGVVGGQHEVPAGTLQDPVHGVGDLQHVGGARPGAIFRTPVDDGSAAGTVDAHAFAA